MCSCPWFTVERAGVPLNDEPFEIQHLPPGARLKNLHVFVAHKGLRVTSRGIVGDTRL